MAELRVYPQGFRELARGLGGIQVSRVLQPPMVRGLERFRSSLGVYPAKGDSTTYRRTGRLGRSWAISYTINARGMTGETGTNAEYARWVQDDELQAWMHRGRWLNTDEQVAQQHRGAILSDFTTVIQGELSRAARR